MFFGSFYFFYLQMFLLFKWLKIDKIFESYSIFLGQAKKLKVYFRVHNQSWVFTHHFVHFIYLS